ncbi:cartilage oligomeric matrix protein-like [Actinia tenebrosa]|uniref:Cartilage oligomeric matrix protein-like n=1 Tax=Actinia tenebrosa TaxID=6105 RepID=A0A6P8HDL6_ACTTE|nr:cartilage oligomeric matrix protein-like [Actinia tenebrosa]
MPCDPRGPPYRQSSPFSLTFNFLQITGEARFNGVDFNGTLFVDTTHDDDYIGIVFSYLDNKHFYAMVWKQNDQVFWKMRPFRATAIKGIQIKAIKSITGPGPIMRNAMWHTGDVRNEVKMLWKDPANQGWKDKTKYFWQLTVRPAVGLIRLRVDTEKGMLVDTGNIWDDTLTGGRIGMYVFSQAEVVWEDMKYACNETIPQYAQAEAKKRRKKQV